MYRDQNSLPKKRAWMLGGAVLVVLFAGMLMFLHRPPAQTETPGAPPAKTGISGWRVDLAGASDGATQFNGYYAPGRILFLPANADFVIISQPAEMRGELEESAISGAWKQNGGTISAGEMTSSGTRQMMHAPRQPGLYRFTWNAVKTVETSGLRAASSAAVLHPNPSIDVLVLTEAEALSKGERTFVKVNGKSIGGYHDPSKSTSALVREHADRYQIPRFFAMLTPETAKLRLGPEFELGNLIAFIDRTDKDGHKVFTTERHTDVLPVRMELIEKLVKLRERLQQKGVKITRFAVTSAFRTPDYNKTVGGVAFSRHCYGDAVDIYIDENGDHHMDDLNGDGKLDRKDGIIIANICRELELEGAVAPGGIGVYEWDGEESVRSHVHIDCRGFISRWGTAGKRSFTWWPPAEYSGEGGD